jgi:hypothetical protein
MDAFSYLSVLLSIAVGLGLSPFRAGAAQLVRYRAAVRSYTPALLWMAMLFLLHVQVWWSVYDLRRAKVWTSFVVRCGHALDEDHAAGSCALNAARTAGRAQSPAGRRRPRNDLSR